MSNPFQNFNRNLGATSPQKIYNDLLSSAPVKGITDFGKGLAQNIGSAYTAANTYTEGGLGKVLSNPILNPLSVPYNAINSVTGGALDKQFKPNKKEKINRNIRTEGDLRAFKENINALPQTFSKNLESSVVNAPEILGSLGAMAIPGGGTGANLGKGLLGAALPSIGGALNKNIDKALTGYREFTQKELNKTAKNNKYSPEVLAAMSPEARAFLQSRGKTEAPKASIRGEALDAMRFKAYKEQSDRLKQLVSEGKISQEQAIKLLEDFNVGQGSQNFIADNVADALNFIPEFKIGGTAGKLAQADAKLNNILRHSGEGNQLKLPLGEIPQQTKLPLNFDYNTKLPVDDGSIQKNLFDTLEVKSNPVLPQRNPEIPKVDSIGEYIGNTVVPRKQADLEANRMNLSPGAIKKREDTIQKYIGESQNEPKTTDFRPLGTSFSPDTPQFISKFDKIANEAGLVPPENVVHVGDQEIPFQNRLQETMINYGNFSRLKRELKPEEIVYKKQVDSILKDQLGMPESEISKFLDQSAYVRANTKKSIDQDYSTKYNDGIGSEGYFAQQFLPNKGNPEIPEIDINSFNQSGGLKTPNLPREAKGLSYSSNSNTSGDPYALAEMENDTYGKHLVNYMLQDPSTDIGNQLNNTLQELNPNIQAKDRYQAFDLKAPEIQLNDELTGINPMRDLQTLRHEDFHGLQHQQGLDKPVLMESDLRDQSDTYTPAQRKQVRADYASEKMRQFYEITGDSAENVKDFRSFLSRAMKDANYDEPEILNEVAANADQISTHPEFISVFQDVYNKAAKNTGSKDFKNKVAIKLLEKGLVNDEKEAELVYDAFFKDQPIVKLLTETVLKDNIPFSKEGNHWINRLLKHTDDIRNGIYLEGKRPNLDYSLSPNVAGDLSRGQAVPEYQKALPLPQRFEGIPDFIKEQLKNKNTVPELDAKGRKRLGRDYRITNPLPIHSPELGFTPKELGQTFPEYSIPLNNQINPEVLRDILLHGEEYDDLAKAQNLKIDAIKGLEELNNRKNTTAKDLGFFTSGY